MVFNDRQHAGTLLAVKLEQFREARPIVLGLTRGGVPVAFEVARALRAPLDVVAVGAVAHHAETGVDAALAQVPEPFQHVVGALDGGHAADPADDEAAVRDPELATRLLAAALRGHPLLQLDAEPDHDELLRGGDAEGDEVVAHLGADGDEPGRPLREPPLE